MRAVPGSSELWSGRSRIARGQDPPVRQRVGSAIARPVPPWPGIGVIVPPLALRTVRPAPRAWSSAATPPATLLSKLYQATAVGWAVVWACAAGTPRSAAARTARKLRALMRRLYVFARFMYARL